MPEMSNSDYDTLDRFILTTLTRLSDGKTDVLHAHADIMHPLTAWDKGSAQEFIPWLKSKMADWEGDNA